MSGISIKTQREVSLMRTACEIVSEAMEGISGRMDAGVTTAEIEDTARKIIEKRGAKCAFRGYRGFPGYICASINEGIVHGIPGERKLAAGDIISIDIGVCYKGYYGDAAITCGVGKITGDAERLIRVTKEALDAGIEQAVPGKRLNELSRAIQERVESAGFTVVRDFVGHGIGSRMHEDPQIPNFSAGIPGPVLREGMVLAIEPMVSAGKPDVVVLSDGWTAVTKDGSLSSHFEHTVYVGKDGPEVLTCGVELAQKV